MPRSHPTQILPLTFGRPLEGPRFAADHKLDVPSTNLNGWRSNGGPTRGHPARSYPYTLETRLQLAGPLVRIHLLGVFAMYAGPQQEVPGTLGASLQLLNGDAIVLRQELVNGRHYSDAKDLEPIHRVLGDGTSIETVGQVQIDEVWWRTDLLTMDVPRGAEADCFKFKVLASPASFVVFDIFAETATPHGCPFHSAGGGVPLSRIGAIVRIGDRVEFGKAVAQLEKAILSSSELDDARGQVLTFLAVVTGALLETGGSKSLLREQLDAARALERATSTAAILELATERITSLASSLYQESSTPAGHLVDRALSLVERNFARPLTDASVAQQLGLSTSHFRYLFRQATGQPFHKYLIAVRLERAREMLVQQEVPVGSVAKAVGFAGLAHFSRAFAQRFSVSPTSVRRGAE